MKRIIVSGKVYVATDDRFNKEPYEKFREETRSLLYDCLEKAKTTPKVVEALDEEIEDEWESITNSLERIDEILLDHIFFLRRREKGTMHSYDTAYENELLAEERGNS